VIYLSGLASALPERMVTNEFFGSGAENVTSKMFLGTKERRHLEREQTAVDLFERAARQVAQESAIDLERDVDAILTNVALPDLPFTGCGAMLAQRLGARPRQVLDLHNGGCVAFLLLVDHARALMALHGLKRVLVCIAQKAAGRIFAHDKIRQKPQSAIPGDGAAVALLTAEGDSPIDPIVQHCHPEFASDMTIQFDDKRKYWEPSPEPGYLDFPESKITTIIMRGNRLVPAVMRETMKAAGLKPGEIDGLVTKKLDIK
jgi:3-oxoacyl-[acyl-carrier-protein] synthase-3